MRESGILMHITSLPGANGVGTMGQAAYDFVDFLKAAGQSYWQILPLTPTGYGDSPYQSCSTYAGNHYLIDLEQLVLEGLLTREEVDSVNWGDCPTKADFGLLYENRLPVLRKAYARFRGGAEFENFLVQHGLWLPDFALFMALKDKFGGKPWLEWDRPLRFREPEAIWNARQELKDEVRFYCFVQYLFSTQWAKLHSYAREQGIRIVGDVPIYVPLDSADVWSSPELFQLDEELYPTSVAGCPPDAFTADGQLWGNPLYRWDRMSQNGYNWWLNRLGAAADLYDMIRFDHFRGFESYWSVPYGDPTARYGKWVKGPGLKFIRTVQKAFPKLRLIAEDLGFLTQEVHDLRDESGLPGMKVLGFAFDSREPSDYLPYNYPANSVCYTGTHDNMTTRQWFDTAPENAVAYATEFMHITPDEGPVWGTIRTAMSTVSDLCVIPMQDYLELGAEGRMNLPGSLSDSNWTWRAECDMITSALAERICAMTRIYGRLPKQEAAPAVSDTAEVSFDELPLF